MVGWAATSFWRMDFNGDVPIGDSSYNSLLMGAATAFFITPLVSQSISALPHDGLPSRFGTVNRISPTDPATSD